ncbi:MAG TPA: hypothetical protein VLE26_02305 [Alphaproteobacteria bacterium]|nr:hypothetical protein [Alphaproteobacteria bacterium]
MFRLPIRMVLTAAALALLTSLPSPAPAQDEEDAATAGSRQVLDCEESARLSIDRDRLISRSISGAQEPDPFSGGGGGTGAVGSAGSFRSELSKYDEERRRRRLIDDCIARSGAAAPQE